MVEKGKAFESVTLDHIRSRGCREDRALYCRRGRLDADPIRSHQLSE
jgi:hypothetical protein